MRNSELWCPLARMILNKKMAEKIPPFFCSELFCRVDEFPVVIEVLHTGSHRERCRNVHQNIADELYREAVSYTHLTLPTKLEV